MSLATPATQILAHVAAHWRPYLSLLSSLALLSVCIRMSRDPELQVQGVAGVLVTILWALWFALRSADTGIITLPLSHIPVDVVWFAGGIIVLSVLAHFWLSDERE